MSGARWVTLILLICVGALAATLARQLDEPAANDAPQSTAAPNATDDVLPPPPDARYSLPPPDTLAELVERPLFSVTRRPPDPEDQSAQAEQVAPPPPVNLPDWNLVGTALTPQGGYALFWDKRNRKFVRIEPGMQVDGWEVAEIHQDAVVLSRGSTRHEVELPRF